MSLAKSFRSFVMSLDDMQIAQVAQQHIPETYRPAIGMVWFARRGGSHSRTFEQASGVPGEVYLDVEIYHPDLDVTEQTSDLFLGLDCYHGEMGDGWVGGMFVDHQGDDYVPQVNFDDNLHLSSVFLSFEIRNYTE
jgi:hypothetical protein